MKENDIVLRAYLVNQKYTAIKRHFESSYDYFKYNGKIRTVSLEKFKSSKYLNPSRRLWFLYGDIDEIEKHFVFNYISGHLTWIDDGDKKNYKKEFGKYNKLDYYFKSDLNKIFDDKDYKNVLNITEEYPITRVVYLYECGDINIETMVILNNFYKFLDKVKKKTDDITFDDTYTRIKNFENFFGKYNMIPYNVYRKILKEVYNDKH